MPRRRALLAGVVGFSVLGGCTEDSSFGATTPTETPTATPEPTPPTPRPVEEALLEEWRFPHSIPCPSVVPCLHRLSVEDDPDAVIVPADEQVDGSTPETSLTTYNLRDEPLVLDDEPVISRWTDHTWVPVVPIHEDRGTVEVGFHETVERALRNDVGRDGRYAVVERGRFGDDSEPVEFGALVDVEDSTWEFSVDEVPTERDGDVVVVDPDADGSETVVLQRTEQKWGLPLVPETVALHPPTATALLVLDGTDADRVRIRGDGTAFRYLEAARVRPLALEPDRAVSFRDVTFTVRRE